MGRDARRVLRDRDVLGLVPTSLDGRRSHVELEGLMLLALEE